MRQTTREREEEGDWLDRAVERWPGLAWALVVGEWGMLWLAVLLWIGEGR